ncbi:MAG: hypothetical protein KJO98_10865 [Rhodothermia bacterium]|nr:hypothetical protein [Rhodothermia bacterium]
MTSHLPAAAVGDRVIRAAIFSGLMHASELTGFSADYEALPANERPRFWRFVADRHGADKEQFYSLAARTYGFEEIEISVSDLIRFVQEIRSDFSRTSWKRMNELRVLPVGKDGAREEVGDSAAARLIFASSDPMRLEVNNYLSTLPVPSFVLRYASARSIEYVIDRVLPVIFSRRPNASESKPARVLPLVPASPQSGENDPDVRRAA